MFCGFFQLICPKCQAKLGSFNWAGETQILFFISLQLPFIFESLVCGMLPMFSDLLFLVNFRLTLVCYYEPSEDSLIDVLQMMCKCIS